MPSPPEGRSRGEAPRRSRPLLALLGLDMAEGVSPADIDAAFGRRRSNAHNLMTRLEELEALQRVPDELPVGWQRAAGLRRSLLAAIRRRRR